MKSDVLRLAWLQLRVMPTNGLVILGAWLPFMLLSSFMNEYADFQDWSLQSGNTYGIIFMQSGLIIMAIMAPTQFFFRSGIETSPLSFPFTLPVRKVSLFRARLLILLVFLFLPAIGPISRGLANPHLYLNSLFDQHDSIELTRKHITAGAQGERQLLYLDRLPQARLLHLQTSDQTQQIHRLREHVSFYSGATLCVPNGRKNQALAQATLYILGISCALLTVVFGTSRWTGHRSFIPLYFLIGVSFLVVFGGLQELFFIPRNAGELLQIEMMRKPWTWLSASAAASCAMLIAAERLWLRREEL